MATKEEKEEGAASSSTAPAATAILPEYILSPEPVISVGRINRRNLQYQYLLDCSEIITKWITDNNKPLGENDIFFCKEFQLPKIILVNNCVKKQTPLKHISNYRQFSTFRYDITKEYGYLHFMGTYEDGIYQFTRFFWKHCKYWDPME